VKSLRAASTLKLHRLRESDTAASRPSLTEIKGFMPILIKTRAEIEKMRASGKLLRQVHDLLAPLVVPGATTMDLENAA
jgi:Xaa-Pro aminopeptidase